MSDRPRYTMRQNAYKVRPDGVGPSIIYAMVLDTWYCYREVWRLEAKCGGKDGLERATRAVNEQAVAKLAELEAEHEAWMAAA